MAFNWLVPLTVRLAVLKYNLGDNYMSGAFWVNCNALWDYLTIVMFQKPWASPLQVLDNRYIAYPYGCLKRLLKSLASFSPVLSWGHDQLWLSRSQVYCRFSFCWQMLLWATVWLSAEVWYAIPGRSFCWTLSQGSFCVCAQPMRDGVTL